MSLPVLQHLMPGTRRFAAVRAGFGEGFAQALATAAELTRHPGALTEVRFVLFDRRTYSAFAAALAALPPQPEP